jgi:hypothetical protein
MPAITNICKAQSSFHQFMQGDKKRTPIKSFAMMSSKALDYAECYHLTAGLRFVKKKGLKEEVCTHVIIICFAFSFALFSCCLVP